MPCRDDGAAEHYLSETNTLLTQMLCYVMTYLEEYEGGILLDDIKRHNQSLRGWWRAHKAQDAARVAQEAATEEAKAIRKEAMKKLTAKERAALGLNS